MTVVGARPQFIKAAVLSPLLAKHTELKEILVHTGQHYDYQMTDVMFNQLDIPTPDYNLEVGSGMHGEQTGHMLAKLEELMVKDKPDLCLVYGDTNSTLAAALAAVKLKIPTAHIESGLRYHNRHMPENLNRLVVENIADYLFTPCERASQTLLSLGVPSDNVFFVGDVMYDLALQVKDKASTHANVLNDLDVEDKPYILATVHRAENTDDPARLSAILTALNEMTSEYRVVLPLHPRTKKIIDLNPELQTRLAPITVTEPQGFLEMVSLVKAAKLVVTDSGGLQKEAFFHNTPCVILYDETAWQELVDMGWASLTDPSSKNAIIRAILDKLENPQGQAGYPYGQGNSGELIVEKLAGLLG